MEAFGVPASGLGPSPSSGALARLSGDQRTEYWACLALRCSKGLGARSIRRLLSHFGSAYAAMNSVHRWDEAAVPKSKGQVLSGREWRVLARPEWESSRDLDGSIILWTDPQYPAQLRELPDAPALLYARGDMGLLRGPCVAVVGSRACTAGRVRLTRTIAGELADSGITVVSGLARGIDGAAHEAALDRSGGTIAVLGAGLDVVYPPEHHNLYRHMGQSGLLLSEFPPTTLPDGRHFPIRNRIISGLSLGVLVMEGAVRSGSLVTARLAMEQNRAVYAVPALHLPVSGGEPAPEEYTDGCTLLLEQGARPCLCAADILADLLPQLEGMAHIPAGTAPAPALSLYPVNQVPPPAPILPEQPDKKAKDKIRGHPPGLRTGEGKKREKAPSGNPVGTKRKISSSSPVPACPPDSPESRIILALREHGPLLPDEFPAFLPDELAVGQLSALLLMLEVRGLVRRLPGPRYEVV